MASSAPRLALTTGEPAGIGPDLLVAIAQDHWPADLIAIGDPDLLQQRAAQLGLPLTVSEIDPAEPGRLHTPGHLRVLSVPLNRAVNCGEVDIANAPYVLQTLQKAAHGCLSGQFQAMVTAPLHKGVINDAGIPFTGHTEYLARETGAEMPVMMLTAPGLRVALVTTHLPLHAVAAAISCPRVVQVIRVLLQSLPRWFACPRPRISVCGLNPHAGEGGHLGREELDHIIPAIQQLRTEGHDVRGPLPADTAFVPTQMQGTDVIVTMYHDQGLPVLKHLGFGSAVNITLGLPIIRTSVDHGTAFDLAGSGSADAGSLRAAITAAIEMIRNSAGTGTDAAPPARAIPAS